MYLPESLPIPWRALRFVERTCLAVAGLGPGFAPMRPYAGRPAVRLLAMGDIALTAGRGLPPAPLVIEGIESVLDSVDLVTGNLEALPAQPRPPAGLSGSMLRAEPETVTALARMPEAVFTLANNHALDHGPQAIGEAVLSLRNHGLEITGVSQVDGQPELAVRVVHGLRIGFLGFCDDYLLAAAHARDWRPSAPAADALAASVSAARAQVDLLVVHLHGGYEFHLHPLTDLRDQARAVAGLGADVVLCHHPHVPMGLEFRGRSLIAHGLGNALGFVSPYQRQSHPWAQQSMFLSIALDPGGVIGVDVLPTRIPPSAQVRILDGLQARRFLSTLGRMSRRLDDDSWLQSLQRSRYLAESLRLLRALTASDMDSGQARERALSLRLPRQQRLISFLRGLAPTAEFACALQEFSIAAGDDARMAASLRQLRRLDGGLAAWMIEAHDWRAGLAARLP